MEYRQIRSIKKISNRTTYELTVKDTHCFFANNILKHNCRCLVFVNVDADHNVSIRYMSRQGKAFTTLSNLNEAFIQLFRCYPGNWVVDGEVCFMSGDKEDFHGIMKEITRKNHTIEYPMYNAFDLLHEDEFWGQIKGTSFKNRIELLRKMYNDSTNGGMFGQDIDHNFTILEQQPCTEDSFEYMSDKVKECGWEGLMLRKDVPYEGKRSKNLLKVKAMQDAEYEVTGVETGPMVYNTIYGVMTFNTVRALLIKHKGNEVRVGAGMTREQRTSWYEDHQRIIGKTITVQYFEETQDSKTLKYSLRFPILKYVYEDNRTV